MADLVITTLALGVGLFVLEQIRRIARQVFTHLESISTNTALLFYAVEQVYEMSGVPKQFQKSRPEIGRVLGPAPVNDVEDEDSVNACNTLLRRMERRMELVYRLQQQIREGRTEKDPKLEGDPDWAMTQGNRHHWILNLPRPPRWPYESVPRMWPEFPDHILPDQPPNRHRRK